MMLAAGKGAMSVVVKLQQQQCAGCNAAGCDDKADRVYGTVGLTLSDGCSAVGSHNGVEHDRSHCPEVSVVHHASKGWSSLAMPNRVMLMTRHSDVHDHVVQG